jgi:tRNA nucleotidyltransferase (CCA-adding enzyme)
MTETELIDRIVRTVTGLGGIAYMVGGGVRDALLGLPVKDTDLLVTGVGFDDLVSHLNVFARVDVVGMSFGVLKVSSDGATIDVALPRTERSTGVGHKDFEVTFDPNLGVEFDLARRDFTVNAIALHLPDGAMFDPFGGQRDLEKRVLRAVGDPVERFTEDPLRMLRAARFVAKLDFNLEASTFEAMRSKADLISTVAPERVQTELLGLLEANHAEGVHRALRALRDSGLLERIVPEWKASIGFDQRNPHHQFTLDEHVFHAVRYAVSSNAPLNTRLALLLHDIAKPMTQSFDQAGIAHYYGHEVEGAHLTRPILERLKLPTQTLESATRIVRQHMRPPTTASDKVLRRWINELGDGWRAALDCREADLSAHVLPEGFDPQGWADQVRSRCESFGPTVATFDERELALSGQEIMRAFNLNPGPELGGLKKLAAQAVVDGELENEADKILAWLTAQISS